jgi:hypothetical protein
MPILTSGISRSFIIEPSTSSTLKIPYVKVPGVLYSYTHDLYGFLEFVSEDVFRHLKEDLGHWSLFSYRDKELELHYCVLFGTVALINHDRMATGKLQVLNGEFDAEESIFQLDYYWSVSMAFRRGI